MVYIPRISFKTGTNPSVVKQFAKDGNFTGTQKLLLTNSRIFGTKFGGNHRSGVKEWRHFVPYRSIIRPHELDLQMLKRYMPWMKDSYELEYFRALNARREEKKIKKEAKKKRKK